LRHRNGLMTIAMGAVFFGGAFTLIGFSQLVGLVLTGVIAVYFLMYVYEALTSTSNGKTAPPPWPELSRAYSTIPQMVGCVAACFAAPVILTLVAALSMPGGLSDFVSPKASSGNHETWVARYVDFFQKKGFPPDDARLAAMEEVMALGVASEAAGHGGEAEFGTVQHVLLLLLGLSLAAGVCYCPIALLITTQFKTSRPTFNYPYGAAQALRIMPEYAIAAVVALVLFAAGIGAHLSMSVAGGTVLGIPLLGALGRQMAVALLDIYLLLVLAGIVGRLFYSTESRLGWFTRSGF
ncbi:hypothetical protein ACFL59_13910, partial [Planctomycetota bacterium]